jgi:hypothetical protein
MMTLKYKRFMQLFMHFSGIQIVIRLVWDDPIWILLIVEVGWCSIPSGDEEESRIQEQAFQVACQGKMLFCI